MTLPLFLARRHALWCADLLRLRVRVRDWCELRADFRSFRTDRVDEAEFLEDRYPERPAMLRARWRRTITEMMQRTGMREAAGGTRSS